MLAWTVLVLTLPISASAAEPVEPVDPAGGISVSIEEVLAAPANYDNRLVTIRGWASIRPEDRGIWRSAADYEARNWRHCISLLNHYRHPARNRVLDRKDAIVTGTIVADIFHDKEGKDIIVLGACNPIGIRFADPDGLRAP